MLHVMWDSEPLYAVFRNEYNPIDAEDEPVLFGLTKNKKHAEDVAKELDGWVETTKWISEW